MQSTVERFFDLYRAPPTHGLSMHGIQDLRYLAPLHETLLASMDGHLTRSDPTVLWMFKTIWAAWAPLGFVVNNEYGDQYNKQTSRASMELQFGALDDLDEVPDLDSPWVEYVQYGLSMAVTASQAGSGPGVLPLRAPLTFWWESDEGALAHTAEHGVGGVHSAALPFFVARAFIERGLSHMPGFTVVNTWRAAPGDNHSVLSEIWVRPPSTTGQALPTPYVSTLQAIDRGASIGPWNHSPDDSDSDDDY